MIHITEPNSNKPRWLTPTAINKYLRCPRQFYLSKIKKVKQLPNIHLLRGICVHNAIDQFFNSGLHQCQNMLYSDIRRKAISFLHKEWEAKDNQFATLGFTSDDLAFYFHESKIMMIHFIHHLINPQNTPAASPVTEKTLFSKTLHLLGRPDLMYPNTKTPLLIEFKTSKSAHITDDIKRQVTLYALLFKDTFGTLPDTAIHFLRFENGYKPCPINSQDLEETRKLIFDIHQKTSSDKIEDYPCTCGYCHQMF